MLQQQLDAVSHKWRLHVCTLTLIVYEGITAKVHPFAVWNFRNISLERIFACKRTQQFALVHDMLTAGTATVPLRQVRVVLWPPNLL